MNDYDEIIKLIETTNSVYSQDLSRVVSDYNAEETIKKDYRGRQIYELLQNADDCYDENNPYIKVKFELRENLLIIQNSGKAFSARGIQSLMVHNYSSKYNNTIGCKGLGFRSVLNWSDNIKICTKDFIVSFSKENAEKKLEELKEKCKEKNISEINRINRTSILSSPTVSNETSEINKWIGENYSTAIIIKCFEPEIEKIKKQLSEFKFEELLFLDHINEIIINIHNCLCRKILSNKSRNNNYTLCELKDGDNVSKWKIKNRNGSISSSKKNYQLSLAYNLNKDSRESIIRNGFLYSFFKTDIKMPFPFLIHGTFNLSSERNSLIKQDNENRELLLILIDFIAEFAIEISKEENDGICGYEPLKCLIPSGNFGVLDDQYDFGNLLKNKIKNLKIFPCINDEYVCLNDEPKYSDNRFDLFVNKTSFSKLLKHCDESYIVEYLTKQLNVSFYKVDEMTNLLNKDSSFYVSENRNFDLIKLFDEEYGHYYSENCVPDLLIDSDGMLVKNGSAVFINPEQAFDFDLPKWANIIFINKELELKLKDYWKLQQSMYLANYLKKYNCQIYSFEKLLSELINQTKDDKEKIINLICWLFNYWVKNGQKFDIDFSKAKINVRIIDRDGKIVNCSKCYFGKEYSNHIGEKILNCTNYGVFVAGPDKLNFNTEHLILLKKCLTELQVKSFPEITCKKLNYDEAKKYLELNQKIHPNLKLHSYGQQENYLSTDFSSFKSREIYVDYIEGLEDILDKAEFEDILYWLLEDDYLHNIIYSNNEINNNSCMKAIPRGCSYQREVFNDDMVSWIKSIFQKQKWIPTETNQKVCVSDVTIRKNNLSPIVEVLSYNYENIASYFDDNRKKDIENLFDKLGIADDLVNLPKEKIYEILYKLPERDVSESINLAKKFYTQLNLQFDTDEVNNLIADNENYDLFIKSGKVLALKGKQNYVFLPINEVFYVGKNMFNDEILESYSRLVLNKRAGDDKVKKMFGVNPIQDVLKIELKDYTYHQLNNVYAEEYKKILPYLYSKRIAVDKKNKELSILKNSRIILVSDISIEYVTNNNLKSSITTGTLNDFEMLYTDNKVAYVKVPNNITDIVKLKRDSNFKKAIVEALSTMLNVDSVKDSFRMILEQENFSEIENYLMENGDDDLMELKESKSKFDNLINYKEEFWNSIHEISPGNKFKFEKCFDNLNYININDSKNFDALIKIFKQIEKDISDYNHVSSVNNINITDYFRKKLDELKNKYRAKYFYKELEKAVKNNNLSKKLFKEIQSNYNFKTFDDDVKNSVNYNYEMEFEEFIGCKLKDLEGVAENYEILEQQLEDDIQINLMSDKIECDSYQSVNYPQIYKEICENVPNEVLHVNTESINTEKSIQHHQSHSNQIFDHLKIEKTKENNGFISESIVYAFLKKQIDNNDSIEWVSENGRKANVANIGDDSLGYDIKYTKNGEIHYVEVKSSTSCNIEFNLTKNEFEFAQKNKNSYDVWFVHIESGQPQNPIELAKFFALKEDEDFFKNSKFTVENGDYKIKAKIINN